MPDPDLLVRTSGEYRISNFLLWELAYTELVFTDVLWPDFRREHLFEAVARVPAPRPPLRRRRRESTVVELDCARDRLYRDQGVVLRTTSWARPTASSRSSPRATARCGRWPRACARPRAGSAPGSSRRATSRCSATRAASSTSSPRPRRSTATGRCARTTAASRTRSPMLEAVDQVAQEREPNPALYRMLVGALRTLADRRHPAGRRRVLLEAALARGLPPLLDGCARCGDGPTDGPFTSRSTSTRAACCAGTCAPVGGRRAHSPSARAAAADLGGGLSGALAERRRARLRTRSSASAVRALEHHVERRLALRSPALTLRSRDGSVASSAVLL